MLQHHLKRYTNTGGQNGENHVHFMDCNLPEEITKLLAKYQFIWLNFMCLCNAYKLYCLWFELRHKYFRFQLIFIELIVSAHEQIVCDVRSLNRFANTKLIDQYWVAFLGWCRLRFCIRMVAHQSFCDTKVVTICCWNDVIQCCRLVIISPLQCHDRGVANSIKIN